MVTFGSQEFLIFAKHVLKVDTLYLRTIIVFEGVKRRQHVMAQQELDQDDKVCISFFKKKDA